ncbi:MAG: hypothetical protein PHW01_04615 [Patescibacteria group bacterium]|nr:hypothetical protein [Patescibacteria group bacterium]
MRIKIHVLSSTLLAFTFYYFTRSLTGAIALLFTGVILDLDHLLDFWKSRPRNPCNIKEFLHPENYMRRNSKVLVPLHSYEIVILLWLITWQFHERAILVALACAFTLHLILDDIGNELKTFSYFLIYRIYKKFRVFSEGE